MLPLERRRRILDLLKSRGTMRTSEIASELKVSNSTARRDLEELSERGQIDRSHGAAAPKLRDLAPEPPFDQKVGSRRGEKDRIAAAAAKLVPDGSTLIFDSGTTLLALARRLAGRPVTCITLDLPVAQVLAQGETEVWMVGGRVRNGLYSVVGPWGEEVLKSSRADIFFMGADAVDQEVVSNSTVEEATMKQLGIRGAQETILLADHTKFGRRSMAVVCGLQEVDLLIADDKLAELGIMQHLNGKLLRIEVA